jgi:hypothetical protein
MSDLFSNGAPPEQMRNLLVNGVKDFCATESASRALMIREPERICVLAKQAAISIERDEHGNLLITQEDWPEDPVSIMIHRAYEDQFIDQLTDALGIPSFP